jgi:hypothetical protein
MERTDFEQWKGKEVARLLALVETERRYYQEMVATLPVAIAVLSNDRSVVLANRAFRQTFGLRSDEIRRRPMEQILPSAELIERIRSVHTESSSETATHGGLIVPLGDKQLRVDVRPIRSWDEDMELETLIVVQDLSGANVATAQPSAPPFPDAELPAVIWQADAATFQFLAVSGSATTALGFPSEHWLNTPEFFERRIHGEEREATLTLYRSAVERGSAASAEFRMPDSTGALHWCRETIVAPSGGEEPRKLYGVLTLIDERMQLALQTQVSARHEALTGLSARLAHDLNNPLMLIAGYAEEMSHAFPESDPRHEDVGQILKATERISEITAHLTRYARRGTSQPQSVDLAAAAMRLEAKLSVICGDTIAVRAEASTPVWATADAQALDQVLLTLADAAREGSGATEIRIACDSAAIAEQIPGATTPAGTYARVTVRANGTGIEPPKSASLFESILAKSAESALGESLAHAYTAAREWGGDLAYLGDAAGSTFVLLLAPAQPPAVEEKLPEVTIVVPEPPQPLILVVDDEPGIRALVAKILRRERYDVIEASTATEAGELATAQLRPVELLVTDIMLPDHTGIVLAEQLRNQIPGLKVLYMSGYTQDDRARAGDFPPGSKFLQKPFTLGALVAKVRESLEESGQEES